MRAARNEADIGARARQLHPKISADRARAVNTDFHGDLSKAVMNLHSEDHRWR
jgi:hypothetical protein